MESKAMTEVREIKDKISKMSDKQLLRAEQEAREWFDKAAAKPVVYVENTSSPQKKTKAV